MNSCADYFSRCPIPDPYVSFDGEKFRDKLLSNAQGKLQFTEQNVLPQWLDNSVDTARRQKRTRGHTARSAPHAVLGVPRHCVLPSQTRWGG
jgi:hypothetical protein